MFLIDCSPQQKNIYQGGVVLCELSHFRDLSSTFADLNKNLSSKIPENVIFTKNTPKK